MSDFDEPERWICLGCDRIGPARPYCDNVVCDHYEGDAGLRRICLPHEIAAAELAAARTVLMHFSIPARAKDDWLSDTRLREIIDAAKAGAGQHQDRMPGGLRSMTDERLVSGQLSGKPESAEQVPAPAPNLPHTPVLGATGHCLICGADREHHAKAAEPAERYPHLGTGYIVYYEPDSPHPKVWAVGALVGENLRDHLTRHKPEATFAGSFVNPDDMPLEWIRSRDLMAENKDQLTAILCDVDPERLVRQHGAPMDEYSSEAEDILKRLAEWRVLARKVGDTQEIGLEEIRNIVIAVFIQRFGPYADDYMPFSDPDYRLIATRIQALQKQEATDG